MAAQKKSVDISDGGVYILSAGTPVYVKTADICAMTGKSNQWIGQLTSQGTIFKSNTPHGQMYDLRSTMRAYTALLEDRKADENNEDIKIEREKRNAEMSLKKASAIMRVLEAQELQGKMHRSEDVSAMTEDLIFTIRGMLLALPGRLAVDVSNADSAAEAASIIRKEVYSIMEELSHYQYDPKKYEERVKERKNWSLNQDDVSEDD